VNIKWYHLILSNSLWWVALPKSTVATTNSNKYRKSWLGWLGNFSELLWRRSFSNFNIIKIITLTWDFQKQTLRMLKGFIYLPIKVFSFPFFFSFLQKFYFEIQLNLFFSGVCLCVCLSVVVFCNCLENYFTDFWFWDDCHSVSHTPTHKHSFHAHITYSCYYCCCKFCWCYCNNGILHNTIHSFHKSN